MKKITKNSEDLGVIGDGAISAIANASGDLFNALSNIFGGKQDRLGKEAERDSERAKAYGLVESSKQAVLFQDSQNTGDLFNGLFAIRAKEIEAQSNPFRTFLIVAGVGAVILGTVYLLKK